MEAKRLLHIVDTALGILNLIFYYFKILNKQIYFNFFCKYFVQILKYENKCKIYHLNDWQTYLFDTHQHIMWKPLTVWVNERNKKMHKFEHTCTFREIVLPVSCMAKAHPEKSPLILFQLILNQPRYNLIRKSKTVKNVNSFIASESK